MPASQPRSPPRVEGSALPAQTDSNPRPPKSAFSPAWICAFRRRRGRPWDTYRPEPRLQCGRGPVWLIQSSAPDVSPSSERRF
ncbi:hypothetical protein DPEC_G00252190 [Dallia pectoralis]|uniref:Uncharacterized protein n=1 Tax=Dallia pectoralis TaxID=75939 RepID=A0ACC2FTP8_DALPE|nr:hypothetical protein DPEC_G00252190 [Dallia pectoralis]